MYATNLSTDTPVRTSVEFVVADAPAFADTPGVSFELLERANTLAEKRRYAYTNRISESVFFGVVDFEMTGQPAYCGDCGNHVNSDECQCEERSAHYQRQGDVYRQYAEAQQVYADFVAHLKDGPLTSPVQAQIRAELAARE